MTEHPLFEGIPLIPLDGPTYEYRPVTRLPDTRWIPVADPPQESDTDS